MLLPGKSHRGRSLVGLQSMGSLRVRHDSATSLSLFTLLHWRRKWQPTPVFLPGESQGREAWWAAVYGVAQSWTQLKRLSSSSSLWGFLGGASGKEFTCQCKRWGLDPWVGKISWSRNWQPIPVFLPGKSHGQRRLAGYSPWDRRVGHDWATEYRALKLFSFSLKHTIHRSCYPDPS